MITLRKTLILGLVILALALMVPLTAQATAYTWTGTTSNAWNLNTNWGGSGFPNAYTDQATIPSAGANRPVTLSTTALLGIASGNALTISGATSGTTSNSLDIASGGLLGMQGGISIGSRRTFTIDAGGTLRNDAASSATTYTITGAPILNGGTMSSLNGGGWSLSSALNGWGTISAPITTSSTISANVANQTLHITGDVTVSAQRALGAGSTFVSGTLLSIEGGTLTGTGQFGSGITNYNLVNLRGNFNNITLFADAAYNTTNFGPGGWNYFNLTGDSTWNNGSLNIMNFNGYKLDVTGTVGNQAASGLGLNVGTGTLNNPGSTAATLSGDIMTLSGGKITSSGGGTFNIGTQINGYGTLSGPLNITGGIIASGGSVGTPQTLTLDGTTGTGITGSSAGWGSSAYTTLDLKGNIAAAPFLNPNGGIVQLDGVNLSGNINNSGLQYATGQVNVVNASTYKNGTYWTGSTMGINAPLTLSNAGIINGASNVTVNDAGSLSLQNINGALTPAFTANNFTMTQGAALNAAANNQVELTGNFSFQQTNPSNWTNGSTAGLGPDLKMAGTAVQTLEVGGVNLGATLAGMTNNFALNSLTIAPGADVKLVDLFQNATTGTWTPGSEALYLGALNLGAAGDPTFDLNGLWCYVNGVALTDGIFNGITIIDAPSPVPIPPSTILLGVGLLRLAALAWRRKES